jgi:hypothetical protein
MKSLRLMLPVVLMSLSAAAFAQPAAQKSDAHNSELQKPQAPKSQAQKSFEKLKALAGTWEGPVTVQPPVPEMQNGKPMQVSLRVTSMGHLLMHEMKSEGRPDDPITTMYLDGDKLLLTHYCDAGNRPRMVAKTSPDGKTVEFDFVDITGNLQHGHMQHAVFTAIDENHHTEDWTFMLPGNKPIQAHFDLRRVSTIAAK